MVRKSQITPPNEDVEDLRLATIKGNVEKISKILEKRLSVNQVLKGGWTPLLYACSMGHSEVVEFLLERGADPNFHKELFTPLMASCASTRENEEKLLGCVDVLLKKGAHIDAVERHRLSALMFASKEGHLKLVARLLSPEPPGKPANLDLQDYQGWTALFWAVNTGKAGIVELLVRKGAKLSVKDRKGQTCVDLAVSKGLREIADILMDRRACVSPTEPSFLSDKADELYEALLIELGNIANNNDRVRVKDLHKILSRMVFQHNVHFIEKHEKARSALTEDKLIVSDETQLKEIPFHSSCQPYSCEDALTVLKSIYKQMTAVFAVVSFVRLRLQGRPLSVPPDRKGTCMKALKKMAKTTLHQAQQLHDELIFLSQHLEVMDDTHRVIPADIVAKEKDSAYTKKVVAVCIVAAALVVTLSNCRFFRLPFKLIA